MTSVLAGFGVHASYGRLREACQTDVDGTSIDTVEEIAVQLGLEAEQILIPVDHVLRAEADALPAIAVVRQPGGFNHFVVAWSRIAGYVQVMDPAVGRRWIRERRFLDELYVHEMNLPADVWREWAGSDDLTRPLASRLRALGAADPDRVIADALVDPTWRSIAALDAATRMVEDVVAAGGIAAGREAAALAVTLAVEGESGIPAEYWSARAGTEEGVVRARGAVMIHVSGFRTDVERPRSAELAAALAEPVPRPWRTLGAAVVADGGWHLGALGIGLVLAAAGTVVEAALFRSLFDVERELATWPQLVGAMSLLIAVLLGLTLIEVPLFQGVSRLGRHVEARLRIAFLEKLPRLGLAYLRSRPRSDMAERSHALHRIREMPSLIARLARVVFEILATGAALCWLAPTSAPWVLALVAAVVLPPLIVQPVLGERDLRVRTHAGALSRFYLDALLGVVPSRTHGIERALRREHEGRLVDWVRAAYAELRVAVVTMSLQAVVSFALAIALVVVHAERTHEPATVLLLAFWSIALPMAGLELTRIMRELPGQRNLALRMLEPLGALDDEPAAVASCDGGPIAIELRAVSVVAGGHAILNEVDLAIAAGQHVAIVGRSGAGKSSLLGLLLGWVRPSAGALCVDGVALDGAAIAALRPRIAWVDPALHLWNTTLAENLAYAAPGADVAAAIEPADLAPVMARLPEGLGSRLGEGGALVSGGEGQRVRFGRALAASHPRLVLLDEPFRGLDRAQRQERLAIAREHWAETTLLCVTHDVGETAAFPRVLVLEDGRIVEDGAPAVLAADPCSRYAALLAEDAGIAAAWANWRRLTLVDGRLDVTP